MQFSQGANFLGVVFTGGAFIGGIFIGVYFLRGQFSGGQFSGRQFFWYQFYKLFYKYSSTISLMKHKFLCLCSDLKYKYIPNTEYKIYLQNEKMAKLFLPIFLTKEGSSKYIKLFAKWNCDTNYKKKQPSRSVL